MVYKPEPVGSHHSGSRVSAPISSFANGVWWMGGSIGTVPGTGKHFRIEEKQGAGGGDGGGASPCP